MAKPMTQADACQIGSGGISSQRAMPSSEPQVPGALGSKPVPNPQAMSVAGCDRARQLSSAEMAEALLFDGLTVEAQAVALGYLADDGVAVK